ncbi:MAG: NADPH:quinone oxidoreductase family protein [Acidimicrobiia bacterium]|nr:NADPH:quinone oxidoreductase family protein [Acidimicrobiia bacterium]MYB73153.1 NADPH:quinone oxidoreductase family protein [Acidimicrobiia bacterium]MYH99468.1 NADPH:quinone oxidoreductase family protein [Acidimicrobiia bacterium]
MLGAMRAWVVEGTGPPGEVLRLIDKPVPDLREGTFLMEVGAVGVGLPDVFMCKGTYPLAPKEGSFTSGQEVCGTVVQAGDGVGLEPGQRVMTVTSFQTGDGGFAEQCLGLGHSWFTVPDSMDDATAAGFLIPYHTAWIGLVRRGGLKAAETLLVLGAAGGTGAAACSLGAALGARVIGVAGGPERCDTATSFGAHQTVDHREGDIAAAVRELTDGRGVDVVYDPVGGDAYTAATRCVARDARIVLIGFASGEWAPVNVRHVVQRNYSVVGAIPARYSREERLDDHRELSALWDAGSINSVVTASYRFEELPEAMRALESREVIGRVVLDLSSG